MTFEWDIHKAERNLRKHGVSFEIAATVFDDPLHLSIPESASSIKEERWVTVGRSADHRVILVVHTYNKVGKREDEIIRIISAREATRKEKKQYEEGI